jgi:hypothetical protein
MRCKAALLLAAAVLAGGRPNLKVRTAYGAVSVQSGLWIA